jgi:RNAse (barnase) inhibitor barstar
MIQQAMVEELSALGDWLRSHIVNGHVRKPIEIEMLNVPELQALHRRLHEEMSNG